VGARGLWKRLFDNHLEGSSIERYSRVAEAMSNLRYHPQLRGQEMALYGGIALHANNSVVVLLNEQDQVLYQRRLANHLPTILEPLAPHQADIMGVVVESTYNWYWLVDGLMEAGYRVHLANPAAMQQDNGLKYTDDHSDARWLAHL
jgi:hypothetical protein